MSRTVVMVTYRAQVPHVETARQNIAQLVATVLAKEPECGGITMLQDENEPTRITLIELWPSKALFLGPHMQQPHIQAFIESAAGFLAGPPDISFWQSISAD